MMYINAALRRSVIERAGNCCEYCLYPQTEDPFSFHIEHIISEKHEGETTLDNLCLSCSECNYAKGSDIGSIDRETGVITALFNPRTQKWVDHFRLDGGRIEPLTANGRVTVFLLRFNLRRRVSERAELIEIGRYPCTPPINE